MAELLLALPDCLHFGKNQDHYCHSHRVLPAKDRLGYSMESALGLEWRWDKLSYLHKQNRLIDKEPLLLHIHKNSRRRFGNHREQYDNFYLDKQVGRIRLLMHQDMIRIRRRL